MKSIIYLIMAFFVFAVILGGCAKKEEAPLPTPVRPAPEIAPPTQATTAQQPASDEMVTCAYDGMQMKKSDMQAKMEYKGKTLYFCTKDEMDKFMKDPEGYLSGKVKPK